MKSFGNRGASTSINRPTSTALGGHRAHSQTEQGILFEQSSYDEPLNSEKEGGMIKSYFFACVSGFTFSVIFMSLIDGGSAPGGFGSQIFLNIASSIVMMTLAPMLLIPARILADIMRGLQVPRGYSDILIGALLGSVMFLPEVSTGEAIQWKKIVFVLGGAVGGFTYWRSRGFPGLKSKHNTAANIVHRGLGRF